MNIIVTLIRNAATKGGVEGRFVGRIDEPLTPESRRMLSERAGQGVYPKGQLVFSSGLMRCCQTAGIIYPHTPAIILKDLCAFDYGEFSGYTYSDAIADKRFEDWAGAGQLLAYPGGEDPHLFMGRCDRAFRHIVREAQKKRIERVSVITHLYVIRAILQRYYVPRSFYRDWQVDYGRGCTAVYDTESLLLHIAQSF